MIRTLIRAVVVTLLAAAALAVAHPLSPAQADTFTVTDPSDNVATPNTLRWAIDQANNDASAPTIEISPGLAIDLTCAGGGALAYDNAANHPLTIVGNGAKVTQTCAASAVLSTTSDDLVIIDTTLTGGTASGINAGGDVRIEDTTIEDNTGGGITAYTGTATVVRSILRGNSGGAGGGVGAINVVVEDSTVTGNDADNGGGVWSDQTATITNSTITDNTADNSGGGVFSTLNDISLTYATVVENTAPEGANVAMDFAADFTSFASIIALPLGGGTDCLLDGGVAVTSLGYNVTSDDTCELDAGPGDRPNTIDPLVGPLADNGGPTPTRLPSAGSPVLDIADCAVVPIAIDQRGVTRPQGPACDAGAVEVEVEAEPDPADVIVPGQDGQSPPATPTTFEPRFTG